MNRIFLALALVSQLSGLAGMTAVVCEVQEARGHVCCCTPDASNDASRAAHVPHALPTCPCTMAPPLPSPVNQTPATAAASQNSTTAPAVLPASWHQRALDLRTLDRPYLSGADAAPPPLSASHLRC